MSSNHTIAITGVGGGVGQSMIKALQDSDYRIVGLDGEFLGAGLYAVPSSYLIPYASSPDFIERLLEICQKEQCAMLFPGLDAELTILSKNVDRFTAIGTRLIVSNPKVIEAADNKLKTYNLLEEHGVSIPETIDMESWKDNAPPLSFPFILKPKVGGARSKGVHLIKNAQEFAQHTHDFQDSVAQAYIEGDEYTCGTITLNGVHKGTIVMRRILRDGDTYKCFSVHNASIEAEVAKVVAALKPEGALNVQLRLKDGIPYIFEINARCSGTTAARALAGFNEPKMIADFYLRNIEPQFSIREISILRYWKELVVENSQIEDLHTSGHQNVNKPTHL